MGKPGVSLAYRGNKDTKWRQGLRGQKRETIAGSVFTPCGIKWKQKQQSAAVAPDLVPRRFVADGRVGKPCAQSLALRLFCL